MRLKRQFQKLFSTVSFFLLAALLPIVIFAGENEPSTPNTGISNPIKANSIQALVADILKFVVEFGAVLAVFFLIYSGFLFVTASGNEEKISEAKRTFNWTCFGIAIILGAQVLALLISGTITQIETTR